MQHIPPDVGGKVAQVAIGTVHPANEYRLYDDGRTHWECNISSRDAGDEWRCGFYMSASEHDTIPVIAVRPTYHFDIHDKDTIKHWVKDLELRDLLPQGGGIAENFPRALYIFFQCGC